MAAIGVVSVCINKATALKKDTNVKAQLQNSPFKASSYLFTFGPTATTKLRIGEITRAKRRNMATTTGVKAEATATTTIEKSGVKIVRNPPESKLSELGVRSWPKWGCPPSKFPWTYEAKEICYLLQGKVKVLPDGAEEAVEIGAGDLVEFPKGMGCTWDVSVAVDKHYKFE